MPMTIVYRSASLLLGVAFLSTIGCSMNSLPEGYVSTHSDSPLVDNGYQSIVADVPSVNIKSISTITLPHGVRVQRTSSSDRELRIEGNRGMDYTGDPRGYTRATDILADIELCYSVDEGNMTVAITGVSRDDSSLYFKDSVAYVPEGIEVVHDDLSFSYLNRKYMTENQIKRGYAEIAWKKMRISVGAKNPEQR